MKSRVLFASLLALGSTSFAVTAEEPPGQSTSPLLDRCQKMLDMQIAVCNETKGLHKVIERRAGKQPRRKDRQAARSLSAKEAALVAHATKAIDMLEADGVAVAFPEVFRQLRDDMKEVQRRLEMCDVDSATQTIEKDIIDTLQEMITAGKNR